MKIVKKVALSQSGEMETPFFLFEQVTPKNTRFYKVEPHRLVCVEFNDGFVYISKYDGIILDADGCYTIGANQECSTKDEFEEALKCAIEEMI
jgi:hypothetical protein